MGVFSHFLDYKDLEELCKYQYKGGEYTFLDTYMNVFWNKAAEALPKWIAPNVLTLLALFSSFGCCAVTVYYSPTLTEEVPTWALILGVIFIFVYQTLDALDGKQARNTKSSSPLGQLFDHGCDSLTASLLAVAFCGVLGMGNSIWSYMMVLGVQLPVLVLNWHEIHSHVFLTSTGDLGVTEGQFATMATSLWVAMFGRSFWNWDLIAFPPFLADMLDTPYLRPLHILAFPFLATSFQMMFDVVPVSLKKTDNRPLALWQLFSFFVWIFTTFAVWKSGIYDRLGIFAWAMFATTFSSLASRLVISATVKKQFAPFQPPLIPYYIMSIAVLAVKLTHSENIVRVAIPEIFRPLVPGLAGAEGIFQLHDLIFVAHAIFCVAYFTYYITTTIDDITSCLGIYAFSLERRTPVPPIEVFRRHSPSKVEAILAKKGAKAQ